MGLDQRRPQLAQTLVGMVRVYRIATATRQRHRMLCRFSPMSDANCEATAVARRTRPPVSALLR